MMLKICGHFNLYTLHELDKDRCNNLNVIRLISAILVVFAHSYPLALGKHSVVFGAISTRCFGYIAILSFFTLSGYLITRSYCFNENMISFIVSRVLRIVPGYIGCLLLSIFIGSFLTNYDLAEYFLPSLHFFVDHVRHLILPVTSSSLPEVFSQNPLPNAVNGSLWSLPIEVRMYVIVLLLGFFGLFNKKNMLNLLFSFSIFMLCVISFLKPHIFHKVCVYLFFIPVTQLIVFPVAFFVGMYFYLYRKYIPISIFPFISLLFMLFLLPYSPILQVITVSYAVLLFGFHPKVIINKFLGAPDYSYGIYIFSFPIQQTIVSVFKIYDPHLLFYISLPVTLFFAALSWHYVEKPSLNLKGRTQEYIFMLKEKFLSKYVEEKV